MSLPWFPFHIDRFLSDTMELDGPAGGAYLFLMLHYYATEKPPRDNDRTLATIARLPIDVWIERRPDIEPFFQIRDGAWHHPTIEAEIAEAKLKHSSSIARASAGGLARWGKGGPKPAKAKPQAMPKASSELAASMRTAQRSATSTAQAQPEQSSGNAHIHKQESLSVSVMTGEKDNSGDNSPAAFPQNSDDDTPTPISSGFWPCENHIAVCNIDGADPDTIKREVETFIATHQERGTFSHDWDASWTVWWKRWRDHRDAQAAKVAKQAAPKPRVEVSTVIDWDAHMKRWQSGMGWPRGVGPDPSSLACRCPPEILAKYAKEKV